MKIHHFIKGAYFIRTIVPKSILALFIAGKAATRELSDPPSINRYIAIDNVCAWPNLTLLPDGSIAAVIHNTPSHGTMEGSIDCWVSKDGQFWKKQGIPAPNDPNTVRMNVAAGLANNGDLLVLCSGWTNEQQPGQPKRSAFRDAHLPVVVCRSGDHGKTWKKVSLIGPDHNETTLLYLGGKNWLAGARLNDPGVVELFYSKDNGATWQGPQRLTESRQYPGHLLRLKDGRILFTYGNRGEESERGVQSKLSSDEGKTWSSPIRLAFLGGDLGYPGSVQRADGKIVTAYYSGRIENHMRYHMGVAIWDAP